MICAAQAHGPPGERNETNPPRFPAAGFHIDHRVEKKSVLGRPGSDLLFQALRLSTIGAEEFNGRVRDGNGFRLLARTTRSAKDGFASWFSFQCRPSSACAAMGMGTEN